MHEAGATTLAQLPESCTVDSMPRAAIALDAVTRVPAEIIGMGNEVGSLEVGKHGNVVLYSGDPLSVTSTVQPVLDSITAIAQVAPAVQRLIGHAGSGMSSCPNGTAFSMNGTRLLWGSGWGRRNSPTTPPPHPTSGTRPLRRHR